jgi:hypothetical protein
MTSAPQPERSSSAAHIWSELRRRSERKSARPKKALLNEEVQSREGDGCHRGDHREPDQADDAEEFQPEMIGFCAVAARQSKTIQTCPKKWNSFIP